MPSYTGVGSRKTPQNILNLMTDIANYLAKRGYKFRSGHAKGADLAFEAGAGTNKEIYFARDCTQQSMAIAASYWKPEFPVPFYRMKEWGRKLHGRNPFQVLGRTLNDPSEFLVCWTEDGCTTHEARTIDTGGTGTAISIANGSGIRVYNLATESDRLYWEGLVYQKQEIVKPVNELKRIYTSHYRYPGPDRTDITAKGQDSMGHHFAPTWNMVMGVKNDTMSEDTYVAHYCDHLVNKVSVDAWNWLLSENERTLVCFCAEKAFCHRNILVNYLLQTMPGRIMYMGWKIPK